MNNKEVILVREGGLVVSIVNDIVTFGCLALAFWFNQMYVGGSAWFSAIIAICFFVCTLTAGKKGSKSFTSIEEAIAHLQELKRG